MAVYSFDDMIRRTVKKYPVPQRTDYKALDVVGKVATVKDPFEPVWDYMLRNYHYLGYDNMIGPRIKYLVLFKGIPIAALSYNRASLKIGVRDTFIGWREEQKAAARAYCK